MNPRKRREKWKRSGKGFGEKGRKEEKGDWKSAGRKEIISFSLS